MWLTARLWTLFKWTLPQRSRPNVTYVVQVVVNYSYCTPDDGCGNYPKHVVILQQNQDTSVASRWTFCVCVCVCVRARARVCVCVCTEWPKKSIHYLLFILHVKVCIHFFGPPCIHIENYARNHELKTPPYLRKRIANYHTWIFALLNYAECLQ
jgi:hypothetical protein